MPVRVIITNNNSSAGVKKNTVPKIEHPSAQKWYDMHQCIFIKVTF